MFKLNPTYAAASALVAIQVGGGLIYKLSQRDGAQVLHALALGSLIDNISKAILSRCLPP